MPQAIMRVILAEQSERSPIPRPMQDSFEKRRQAQERELKQLTQRLEKLRKSFDRFFMGLDKVVPIPERDQLRRDLKRSSLNKARNTETRFRFQNLVVRITTLNSRWERMLRKIEEGSFRPPQDR
jgi:hypothetical protein